MTCVKTGAKVYFENYGTLVVGDVFVIGSCHVIRWNVHSKQYISYDEGFAQATHLVMEICNSETWWHREDIGVTVVPSDLVMLGAGG